MASFYALKEILTIASMHPFYKKDVIYPPTPDEINDILNQQASTRPEPKLQDFPLCQKKDLSVL